MFGLGLLPQGEVCLIMLLPYAIKVVATGVLDVLQRTTREDTILIFLIISLNVEVDRAIALVSKTVVEDLLNELLLFDDMTRRMGFDRGAQYTQRIHRLMVAVGVILGNLHRLQLFQTGLLGNLVLALVGIMLQMTHIGNVTHVPYFIT